MPIITTQADFFPNFLYKNLGALTPVLYLPNVVARGNLSLARNLPQIEDNYFNLSMLKDLDDKTSTDQIKRKLII